MELYAEFANIFTNRLEIVSPSPAPKDLSFFIWESDCPKRWNIMLLFSSGTPIPVSDTDITARLSFTNLIFSLMWPL